MKNLIKKIYHLNRTAYQEYKYKDVMNPKTGLSLRERERLLSYPRYTEGEVKLFGTSFYFTDSLGFLHSVDEIFDQEIYKFTSPKKNPCVIDCGANMGLSVAYFKTLYPDAELIAFEPDETTFRILEKNAQKYGNSVKLKKEAVWINNNELTFYSEGSLAGSVVVDFANKNTTFKVKGTDLKKYLNQKVDFLKIDIEGAENTLIFDLSDHLENVEKLFLEYHGIIGSDQNLGEMLNFLKQKGFQYYIRVAGETLNFPFCDEAPANFNQQLNIFCYRK